MTNPLAKAPGRPETLILPVETLNREFDAKLLLAPRAVARGGSVIIGGRTATHEILPRLPASIYVGKGVRIGNRRILRLIEKLGHVIVALDEESLIRQSDEAHLMMLDAETFNRPRLLYAWGRSNAEVWRGFKGYGGAPILEVGNPRMDLLRPELRGYYGPEAEALRQRHGAFVLVSCNFSMVNHFIPDHVRFRTAAEADAARRDEIRSGLVAHKRQVFEAFRAMVPDLARAIAPVTLVIRPHPSENVRTWKDAASGLSNVKVIHEGPIAPWLMAAKALIQNGCTSAVEAAVLGTPSLAYHPVVSAHYEVALSDGLSRNCHSLEQLVGEVKAVLAAPATAPLDSAQWQLLKHHIASVDGPMSAERILDSLDEHASLLQVPGRNPWRYLQGLAGHFGRRAVRSVTTRLPRSRSGKTYTAHKFPGIGEDLLDAGIARFRALAPELTPVRHQQIAPGIYRLDPA